MAHLTDLGFTLLELGKAVDDGRVRTQTHPEFPNLTIANYTEYVQYRNSWDNITLQCRGLIFDSVTGELVARPWKKFFNLGQHNNEIDSDAPVEVTDKMDGSLGILYQRPDNKYAIATRGSFTSEQALHATELLHTKYSETVEWLDYLHETTNGRKLESTFLFEIIYPENRIVVNYGDTDELVMLGAVNKSYGYYYGPKAAASYISWSGPRTETWNYNSFVDAISFPDRKGKEGVVIRSGNKMVKLKQQDYVELHRIVTNLSPKTIWEMISNGQQVSEICADIPDEFHGYVKGTGDQLVSNFLDISMEAMVEFGKAEAEALTKKDESGRISRKAWAEAIKKRKHSALLFMKLDGRDTTEAIWKMVKPRGDVKSLVEDEG